MADASHPRKKRKRIKRCTVDDKVEVRSYDDGFLGSWHPGKVTDCRDGCRVVKYDHILSEDSEFYTDTIEVSGAIDGIFDESEIVERSRIRPPPPVKELVEGSLRYGLCVDAYLTDAWWEGVVFDFEDGSDCREVFFPDLGDVVKVELGNMRITHDWNEVADEWTSRGNWLFLEIIEKYEVDNVMPVSVTQIWYDMRVRDEFCELGEWYLPVNLPLWELMIVEVIDKYLTLSVEQFLEEHELLDDDLMTRNRSEKMTGSAQPMALSLFPSSTTIKPVGKPELRKDSKKWTEVMGKNIQNLKPEFCPQSVDDYSNAGHKPRIQLTTKLRQHVLSLGWKIENSLNAQLRAIYIAPGGKTYHNLRQVVKILKSKEASETADVTGKMNVSSLSSPRSEGERSSETVDDVLNAVVLSPSNLNCTELPDRPEYRVVLSRERKTEEQGVCYDLSVISKHFPGAVLKYLKSSKKERVLMGSTRSELVDDARMHLSAIGWTFWTKLKNGRDEWRYNSPNSKKTYYSLMSACNAIANGKEWNDGHPSCSDAMEVVPYRKDRRTRENKIKPNGHPRSRSYHKLKRGDRFKEKEILISRIISKKKKALSEVRRSTNGRNSTRLLRSSKRVRQTGPPSSSQLPRTVLSWLIENNAVVPRSKVCYREENNPEPLGGGKITRDGIKCSCCQKLLTLSSFQAHVAGNNSYRPAENIYLENGKSLVSCQAELMRRGIRSFSREPEERAKGARSESWNDHICSICHYGGKLILCDQCPSSFHASCLNLQDIPEGDWFCPSCCCGDCGKSKFDMNKEQLTDDSLLCCHQCERQYHARCKKHREFSAGENWFCGASCEKMHWGLQQLLDKPILVGHDNLTWTLVKPMQYQAEDYEDCNLVAMTDNYSKLSVALEVMHECFEPVKEPRTRRDLVDDVLFCRGSNLSRLNFKGFYTVLLERNDELITVATLRVYGDKVAEIPLIGTRFQHRRHGMCRILMNELEKNLIGLGVKKLVLPAAASVLSTWTTSFGFSPFKDTDRSEFLGYTFLDFQDTTMCQKLLRKHDSVLQLSRDVSGAHPESPRNIEGSSSIPDHEANSSMSEVFQEDRREGSDSVDQGAQINVTEDKQKGDDNRPDDPSPMVTSTASCNQDGQAAPPNTVKFTDHKKVDRDKGNGTLIFYRRKKAVELRPPVPQTSYSKVEVSCR